MDRPALDNANNADHDSCTDRQRNSQAQPDSISFAGILGIGNHIGVGSDFRGLFRDRDQGRLGNRGAESQRKGKHDQPEYRALAHERMGHTFAHRKQAQFQTPDKQGQTGQHQQQPGQQAEQVRQGLLQDRELKEPDHPDYGRQVAQTIQ